MMSIVQTDNGKHADYNEHFNRT